MKLKFTSRGVERLPVVLYDAMWLYRIKRLKILISLLYVQGIRTIGLGDNRGYIAGFHCLGIAHRWNGFPMQAFIGFVPGNVMLV